MNVFRSMLLVAVGVLIAAQSNIASCQDAPDKPAAESAPPSIKFVLDDKPLPVDVERLRQGVRYAAVVRGFASLLLSEAPRGSDVPWRVFPKDLSALASVTPSPASVRLQSFVQRFSGSEPRFVPRLVLDYDEHVAPPTRKQVLLQGDFVLVVDQLKGWGDFLTNSFHPARELRHPPLQEYVFYAEDAELAKQLAADFVEVYDHGFLLWLRKLAEEKKRKLIAARDEAVPKLADLQKQIDEATRALEGVEKLEYTTVNELKAKRTLLKVDLAGVNARLETIDDRLKNVEAGRLGTRLEELKVAAQVDLASLSGQQKALDEVIDAQRRLGALGMLKIQKLYPLRDAIKQAERELPRCEEVLGDLIPFQLVDGTVVIRPVTIEPSEPAAGEK